MKSDPPGVLEVGADLPEVTGLDDGGEECPLAEAGGEGWTLVYFFPKARTPGCTLQACSLRDAYEELQEDGIRVIGVSTDTVESQHGFREKRKLPFTLLADPEKVVIRAFGVPTMLGQASRMAFLFRDGVLVWRDLSASTTKQAADVLKAVREG